MSRQEDGKQKQRGDTTTKDEECHSSSDYVLHTSSSPNRNYSNNNDENAAKVNYKTDKELLDILRQVDLIDVADRTGNGDPFLGLDSVLDWANTLSLGEQQRLAFGRILVNQPKLVIMDESTSAMDVSAESTMYQLLQQNKSGITYISVGHRPTLLKHHDIRLHLTKEPDNNTSYKIDTIHGRAEGAVTEQELQSFYG